VTNSRW